MLHTFQRGPGPRLICFPHGGAAATVYRGWRAHLPDTVELAVVQYPGRWERSAEPYAEDVHALADDIAGALPMDRPVALFGHSLGSLIAYEVACRLPVARLFVSGRGAPQEEPARAPEGDAAVLAEMRRLGGTDERLLADPAVRARIVAATRADFEMNARYRHRGGVVGCPISALMGSVDPAVTPVRAARWREVGAGDFDLTVFPGGHFYLAERETDVVRAVACRLPGE